ncbi:MAG TPA: twin-arginine translocase TatA/TatE family subunit [Acidobacteriota bacterium]|nr:twin-arginine translocase TatA/TatE family subunit [Acidobacteriota bacterium]
MPLSFMGLGAPELVVILLIVVVIFGASRLPQLGKGLGQGISNFRKSVKSETEKSSIDEAETKEAN